MLQLFTKCIVGQLVESGIVDKKEEEIYQYGIYLLLMTSITTLTILAIGILLRQMMITVVFLCSLMSLRHYTGGYHAQSYIRCFSISCLSYFFTLIMVVWVAPRIADVFWLVLMGLAALLIFRFAPLNSEKNPKTEEEMQLRRKYSYLSNVIFVLISIVIYLFCSNLKNVAYTLVCTQVIVAISLIATQIQRGYFLWKLKK